MNARNTLFNKKIWGILLIVLSIVQIRMEIINKKTPQVTQKISTEGLVLCVDYKNDCVRLIQSLPKSDQFNYVCDKIFDLCKKGCRNE